jgi:hypothetical protein
MLSLSEEITLKKRGITIEKIEEQLACFSTGFPFLEIRSAAEPGKGILVIKEGEIPVLLNQWEEYRYTNASIVKFVPASGAASRMFKDLFGFLEGKTNKPNSDFEKKFFTEIKKFAFFDDLDKICRKNNEKSIDKLIEDKQFKTIVENLLYDKGLNYGSLPKGLLKFHSYPTEKRTPMQEHMVEGAMYSADASGKVNIHFTVSKEHRALFEKHLQETIEEYQKKYKIIYNVSFSEQKPSTDTIAADENNQPFRDKGELVFRPGGHGALIENLNDLNSDIVFIKNIDNVVPDWLKDSTVTYKKVIAGILIHLQKQCFAYLNELEKVSISDAKLKIIAQFCEVRLNNYNADLHLLSHKELRVYLINKLNRPMRVCGMVKNVGEPGGGPFLTVNSDGTISPQILESSQINLNNPHDKEIMMKSTHFNPVDLVCSLKNYKGEKFDLLQYVDKSTGFISLKSKNGKKLKALELPGLWNGAMSDWNTIFVEVPLTTFNPVKTVNDLLRVEHQ